MSLNEALVQSMLRSVTRKLAATQEASSRCCSTKARRIESKPSLRRASSITSDTLIVDLPACLIRQPIMSVLYSALGLNR